MHRVIPLVAPIVLALLPVSAPAQQPQQLQPSGPAAQALTLNISAKVGGKTAQATGAGECRHAPDAAINGASASLWMVRFDGGGDGVKQLNLTLWRPKDGTPDLVSLTLETKSGTHRVEADGKGKNQGEATVVILPHGPGGRLEITGKDAGGKPMQIAVDCPAYREVEAEGG
jgi:hypothetical protein